MNTLNFNAAKAETFEDRIVEMLNLGSLALITSLGHRTGLFSVMADMSPSTIEKITRIAG